MGNLKELLVVSEKEITQMRSCFQKSEIDIQQDVSILKEWLRQQPHLPHDEDEGRLERMFLKNKCRLEQTKKKLDKCYSFKLLYPEFMDMYDIKSLRMQNARNFMIYVPLPKLTDKQERIFCLKILNADAFRGSDCYMYLLMMVEFCNTYDYSLGDILIIDFEGFSVNAMKTLEPSLVQNYIKIYLEALSGRLVELHFINAPTFMDIFMQVCKAVFKPKLFAKIKYSSNMDSVYQSIPNKMLPAEYGGEEKSIYRLQEEWVKELECHAEVLMKISKRISNEKVRIGDLNDSQSFGTDGSFRKINLD